MEHRYHHLQLSSALSRRCDYPQACKELACILRRVYARAPKGVQHAIYEDVLSAFRLLPGMDTVKQLSAADLLLQAAEATLPKRRKTAAVSEYKQAAVAQHRRTRHDESTIVGELMQLSTDMLLHIFGFLDPCSLAMSSAVCKAWNEASNDDGLWRTHFLALFDAPSSKPRSTSPGGMFGCEGRFDQSANSTAHGRERPGCWRTDFVNKLSQPGRRPQLIVSNRAFCTGCKALFWMSGFPANKKLCLNERHTAKPATMSQVLTYVLRAPNLSSSSSSSDSDTDEDFRLPRHNFSRLWAYPRLERSVDQAQNLPSLVCDAGGDGRAFGKREETRTD